MSLTQTIGKNTFYGVADKVTQLGTRLILVPIVTAHIGLDGYGVWAIIVIIMAHMRFGAIGVKSAFQKYVAEATGSGDFDQANRLVSTGAAAILALSVLGLVPIALFSLPLVKAMGVPEAFLAETANACMVLALIMVISNFAGVYEAVIMGAQRIDIVKKITIVFLVLEAVIITCLLYLGGGIFHMAMVMALSETGRMCCYFFIAGRILPQIRVKRRYLTRSVLPELARFAGTYQLSNLLEVVYVAVLPIAVLKLYGAEAAGVFAISQRLVMVGALFLEALLLPLLSGGAMIHGSGSQEKLEYLLRKSFKTALILAMMPLAFVGFFGEHLVLAWVGVRHEFLLAGLWFFCLARFFRSIGMISFVFYRATGGALMDIARQMLRITCLILLVAGAGRHLGYYQLMAGFALIELFGMLFIFKALKKRMPRFSSGWFTPDVVKMILCTVLILIGAGLISTALDSPALTDRWMAAVQIIAGCLTFALVGIPCLLLSRYFTNEEYSTIRAVILPRRMQKNEFTE
ncbi:MAG: lipopolysaccharide biosynthesis protein [Planctomycetota bacterium]|jgi:O-antigen/teichoic acid export membrane protein